MRKLKKMKENGIIMYFFNLKKYYLINNKWNTKNI